MLIALSVGLIGAGLGLALLLVRFPKAAQATVVALTCLATLWVGLAQPAFAGAVDGDVLTNDQQELNEKLQTTPSGNQYQGIEYADVKGTPLGDREITDRVVAQTPKDLKISVSNGSVRLSGKVSDRSAAQAIIKEVKAIPGVHEVSYDLGLKHIAKQ